jgi:hypothetical protein
MVALVIEFCCVVAWFLWLHRRQVRDRERLRRVPRRQMRLEFEEDKES